MRQVKRGRGASRNVAGRNLRRGNGGRPALFNTESDTMKARAQNTGPHAVYTTGEAAKLAYVSQQQIIRYFDEGALGGFLVPDSKARRIPRKELLVFLARYGVPLDRMEPLTGDERALVERTKAA